MADLAQAGALAYEFAPRQQVQPQQPQPQAAGGGVPQGYEQPGGPKDLFAEREKLTDDYYNNYGLLQTYAHDMAKKGINVMEPDYTQPGGGQPFKVWQMLQANVYHGANALKVEHEMEKERFKEEAANHIRLKQGVKREGFYAQNPDNYLNIQVDPLVQEKNKYLNQPFSTPEELEKARATNYQPTINDLTAQRNQILKGGGKEGVDTEYIDRQIAALTNPNRESTALMTAQIRAAAAEQARTGKEDLKSMLPWFEHVTNTIAGGFKGTPTVVNGKHMTFSPALQGQNFGNYPLTKIDKLGNRTVSNEPARLKGTAKDNTGVYFIFEDPEIQPLRVDNLPPDEVFGNYVASNNGKFGSTAALPAFYNELQRKGYLNENRAVNTGSYFGGEPVAQEISKRPGPEWEQSVIKPMQETFSKLEAGTGKGFTIDTPQGEAQFVNNGDGVELANWEKFYDKKSKPKPGITFDQLVNFAESTGYFQKLLDKHPYLQTGAYHHPSVEEANQIMANKKPATIAPYDEAEWKTLKSGEKRLAPDGSILTKK